MVVLSRYYGWGKDIENLLERGIKIVLTVSPGDFLVDRPSQSQENKALVFTLCALNE
jgi:hypothetical protein